MSLENIECQFCKKTFGTKYILTKHQKMAKYCLSLQGVASEIKCDFCLKKLSSRDSLISHTQICKEKTKKEFDTMKKKYEKEIEKQRQDYEKKLENQRTELEKQKQEYKTEIESSRNMIISEKNEYIAKLEARLDKFESTVVNLAAAEPKTTTKTTTNNVVVNTENENKVEIPIPLHEQMSSIVIEEIKDDDDKEHYSNITLNNIVITSRPIDHYVNATQLCQAGGKLFKDWFRLESTKELIDELSADGGILPSALVETKRGGNDKSKQGSWIHPDLSIQLAQWISPKFAIQVSKWVRTLFNQGSIEIDLNLLHEKERDMRIKDHRIKQLESVCLSKQRRVEYPERNVIYMLTTDDHLQRRTYIIGKAKNLTNRLSTYNKTCDHTVVHYRECKSEEDMETAETMILSKLRDYREQANRDRFILPDNKDAFYFNQTIDECISFLS
jgi:hypothetical protein